MSQQRFTLPTAVYLIFIKNDKVLLSRRFNTGWSDGLYSLPSGHVDGGEPIRLAACREALVETGVTIRPDHLQFVHVMHRKSDSEYIDFFFTVQEWEGEPTNTEPEKCDDLSWFALNNLPDNILPYVRNVIAQYRTTNFSESGW